jgi:copper(I)-binding protein
MRHAAFAAAALLALAPAAFAQGPTLELRHAWLRLPPNGSTTAAGYVDVVNGGKQADRLVGASCACAAHVMIHEMSTTGGVMRMREAEGGLTVQPAGELKLQPGGAHLMLMGLKAPLKAGQHVPLTLEFARGGKMTVEAVVAASAPTLSDGKVLIPNH